MLTHIGYHPWNVWQAFAHSASPISCEHPQPKHSFDRAADASHRAAAVAEDTMCPQSSPPPPLRQKGDNQMVTACHRQAEWAPSRPPMSGISCGLYLHLPSGLGLCLG
jgi:hypothetical protein